MSDLGPYTVKGTALDSAEYRALVRLGMTMENQADGKGFALTIPRDKFFVADAEPLAGMSGKIQIIHEQRTGNPVAKLYEAETIDLPTLSEWWTLSVEPSALHAPSPPGRKTGRLQLVKKPENK